MTTWARWLGLVSITLLGTTPGFTQVATDKKSGNTSEKVICKRETPIGSMIATRKVCLTPAQWDARTTRGNEAARRMVEDNAARNPYLNN